MGGEAVGRRANLERIERNPIFKFRGKSPSAGKNSEN